MTYPWIKEDDGMGINRISETAVKTSVAGKATAARKAEGTARRTVSISKPGNKKKKRINYNYRELSNQLMRARTSMGASQVLVRAFHRVGILQRQYRSGDYNENEARRALIHAESIARVARKRVKHLKEEERLKKGGFCDAELEEEREEFRPEDIDLQKQEPPEMSSEEMERLMEELEAAMRDLERESMETMEELTVAVQEDMDPEDLKMLKKKHRSKELREIMEADLRYLKALFQELEKERREGSSSSAVSSGNSSGDLSGVTLELAGMEMAAQTTAAAAAPVEGASVDVSL